MSIQPTDAERESLKRDGFIMRNFVRYEMFEGNVRRVLDGGRVGWWRFNKHYDHDGYCDNPGRGY